MYSATMYQQPMVIQITEPIQQNLPMKELKDNCMSYAKTDISNRTQQHYQPNNRQPVKKQNQWPNNYKTIRYCTVGLYLLKKYNNLRFYYVNAS